MIVTQLEGERAEANSSLRLAGQVDSNTGTGEQRDIDPVETICDIQFGARSLILIRTQQDIQPPTQ